MKHTPLQQKHPWEENYQTQSPNRPQVELPESENSADTEIENVARNDDSVNVLATSDLYQSSLINSVATTRRERLESPERLAQRLTKDQLHYSLSHQDIM